MTSSNKTEEGTAMEKECLGLTLMAMVDDTPNAIEVLKRAANLQKCGDKLHVLYLMEAYDPLISSYYDGPEEDVEEEAARATLAAKKTRINRALLAQAESLVAQYRPFVDEKAEFHVRPTDNVKKSALEILKKLKVDIVITGTRGRGGFTRFFLGSFSNFLVNNAPCDVMVVRHAESDTPEDASEIKEEEALKSKLEEEKPVEGKEKDDTGSSPESVEEDDEQEKEEEGGQGEGEGEEQK